MTNQPTNPDKSPWLTPFEAGRQWMDLATKAQAAMARQLEKSAQNVPSPFAPEAVSKAFSEFFASLLKDPGRIAQAQTSLWQKHAALWQDVLTKDYREAPKTPARSGDRRFRNEEWDNNIAFNLIKHSYIIGSEWLNQLVAEQKDLSPQAKKQVEFFTRQYIDAVAPTNFPLTNPEVLRRTIETGGTNLLRGFSNLLDDMSADAGHVRRTEEEAFELGVNIATTKGSVVFRTDMMELIQYEPSTETVFQRPLLLVPPWVNKFYLFDLQPRSSFIKWAVDHGFTVFAISWVNPDASHAEKDFENYWLEGPLAALEAIERATGEGVVNLFSYCLGGTLTTAGLAQLAARGEERVASAALIATMTDFRSFGDFEAFVTDEQVAALEQHLARKGYVDSADLTRLFALLRANDLIWSSGISSYLLADEPVASDLLYWFADGIGMPGKMLSTFIREIILENALTKRGRFQIGGTPIDVEAIATPLLFVSLRDDHVCAWEDTYRGALRFKAPKRFILGGSGHNAGTINPPAAGKHGYWTNEELDPDPNAWFRQAVRHEGSWWPEWVEWVTPRSGERVPARPVGAGGLPALEPAPGSYARVRR